MRTWRERGERSINLAKVLKFKPIRYFKKKYWDWQIKKGMMILESLDSMLIKAGYKRQERRQFWREFIKKQETRNKVFERLNGNHT